MFIDRDSAMIFKYIYDDSDSKVLYQNVFKPNEFASLGCMLHLDSATVTMHQNGYILYLCNYQSDWYIR